MTTLYNPQELCLTHTQPSHHHVESCLLSLPAPSPFTPHPHTLSLCLGQLVGRWGLGWGKARGASEAAVGRGWGRLGKSRLSLLGGRGAVWWGDRKDEGGRRVVGPVQLRSPPQQPAWVQKGLFVLRL